MGNHSDYPHVKPEFKRVQEEARKTKDYPHSWTQVQRLKVTKTVNGTNGPLHQWRRPWAGKESLFLNRLGVKTNRRTTTPQKTAGRTWVSWATKKSSQRELQVSFLGERRETAKPSPADARRTEADPEDSSSGSGKFFFFFLISEELKRLLGYVSTNLWHYYCFKY